MKRVVPFSGYYLHVSIAEGALTRFSVGWWAVADFLSRLRKGWLIFPGSYVWVIDFFTFRTATLGQTMRINRFLSHSLTDSSWINRPVLFLSLKIVALMRIVFLMWHAGVSHRDLNWLPFRRRQMHASADIFHQNSGYYSFCWIHDFPVITRVITQITIICLLPDHAVFISRLFTESWELL